MTDKTFIPTVQIFPKLFFSHYDCTHLTDTVYDIPFNFPPVLSPEPTHLTDISCVPLYDVPFNILPALSPEPTHLTGINCVPLYDIPFNILPFLSPEPTHLTDTVCLCIRSPDSHTCTCSSPRNRPLHLDRAELNT